MSEYPSASLPAKREVSRDEQNWAMFCHLAALTGFIVPFGNIIGPLVIWLVKKDTMPLVDQHGKESLNFQITVSIAVAVCMLLMMVLIGFLLLFAVGIVALVLTVIAAIKVSNGEFDHKYPFAIRLLK